MVDPVLPIRLIALDIDGTLVGADLVIGERTLAAVSEASRRGIAVSLVTVWPPVRCHSRRRSASPGRSSPSKEL